jgi:predicted N-acetyltransferase YhbS
MAEQRRVIEFQPLAAASEAEVDGLLDRAFGADRRQRTAYKIRDGAAPLLALSSLAYLDSRLVGSLHSWPVLLTQADGSTRSLVMVGPIAVEPAFQGQAIGNALTSSVAARLDANGQAAMMIGDPEYYEQFGFLSGPASRWLLPGPVQPHRILLRVGEDRPWPETGRLSAGVLRSGKRLPS